MDNPKQKHHYVPRHYLRAWCTEKNGALAVRNRGQQARRALVDGTGLAYANRFYSYKPLTPKLLHSILCCSPRSHLVTDEIMRDFFYQTVVLPVYYRLLKTPADNDVREMMGMIDEANLVTDEGWKNLEKFRMEYDIAPSVVEERMARHMREGYENELCKLENAAWPILDSMLKGKTGWVKNDRCAFKMFYYIVSQRLRTPAFIKMAYECQASNQDSREFNDGAYYRRHIIALDKACVLMQYRHSLTFRIIESQGDEQFISGDLPVVEIQTGRRPDYYFPLSPKRAFLFGPSKNFDRRNACVLVGHASACRILNNEIAKNAVNQLYGTTEDILNEIPFEKWDKGGGIR